MKKIPKFLQSVLWSVKTEDLEKIKDRAYIIHQILVYGSFAQLKWLFANYPKKEIISTFLKHPIKMYPPSAFHFTKDFLLGLKKISANKDRYVTVIYGPIRQRATKDTSSA